MSDNNSRPIILISNSSWYLYHYRKLLIENIKKTKNHILALAPYDATSIKLSKKLIHIPWQMSRAKDQNLFSFLISFLRMILLIRAIKPKLIHSHTLQANLITSIVSSIFGINCVLSFAGVGRFSRSKGLSKRFFQIIFKTIYFFNSYQRKSRFKFILNQNRSVFIFQNNQDVQFIKNKICNIKHSSYQIIPGSGVPKIYIKNSKIFEKNNKWLQKNNDKNHNIQITFIYCARLLRSKGILTFLELSNIYKNERFYIYGSIDSSSKDSLTKEDLSFYKKYNKNVIFMNNKSNPLLFRKFNFPILIVPSIYGEGFPRGIIEANTLCIPVITSKDASNKIPFKNISYTCENHKPEDYSKCIKKIIKDYKDKKLGLKLLKARNISIKNFSEEVIVKKTLDIYDSLNTLKNKSYLIEKDQNKLNDWLSQ